MCRREIEDACASKKSKLSDGLTSLWYESLLIDAQRMIHLIRLVVVIHGCSIAQAQMIPDEVCKIAETLDFQRGDCHGIVLSQRCFW